MTNQQALAFGYWVCLPPSCCVFVLPLLVITALCIRGSPTHRPDIRLIQAMGLRANNMILMIVVVNVNLLCRIHFCAALMVKDCDEYVVVLQSGIGNYA